MTSDQFNALRYTFPWKRRYVPSKPGLMVVVNAAGQEVPLNLLLDTIELVTSSLHEMEKAKSGVSK
jgi:hypothetical protein